MIRIADVHSARASAGISMRAWLYLGFAVLGLALMGLDDNDASRMSAAQPDATQAAQAGAAQRSAAPATPSNDTVAVRHTRTVKLDVGHVTMR